MKKLIECVRGYTETSLGGQSYVFARDAFERFTADVPNLLHRSLFLNVEHYREVDEIPAEMQSQLDALEYDEADDELGDGDDDEDEDEDEGNGTGDPDAETDEDAAGEPETPTLSVEPETPETPPVAPPAPEETPVDGEPDQSEPVEQETPAEPVAPAAETPAPAKRSGKKAS